MGARGTRKGREPSQVGDLLDAVFGRSGLKNRIREKEVLLVWEEAVGEIVFRNSRPLSVANGILVVETRDNVWMQELSMMRRSIVEKINEIMGWEAIKELRFKIGTAKEKKPPRKPVKSSRKKTVTESPKAGESNAEIEEALAGVEDPELKAALRNMMMRGLEREKPRS